MAVSAKLRAERGIEVESMWSDDGFVLRMPESDEALDSELFFPSQPSLSNSSCNSSAAPPSSPRNFAKPPPRALFFLGAAPDYALRSGSSANAPPICWPSPRATPPSRSCSKPTANASATSSICPRPPQFFQQFSAAKSASPASIPIKPSPFASALLFSYIANYIYEGDAPLAERRAQALSIDQSQLEEILGDTDLRELLDKAAIDEVEAASAIARSRLPGPPRRRRSRPAAKPGRPHRIRNRRAQLGNSRDRIHDHRSRQRSPRRPRSNRRRIALHPRRIRRPLSRRARHAAPSRPRRSFSRAREPIRCANSFAATRARTALSPRSNSPRAIALPERTVEPLLKHLHARRQIARRRIPPRRPAPGMVRSRSPAARFAARPSPACAAKSNPSNSAPSRASSRAGKASPRAAAASTRFSTPIENLQGTAFSPPNSSAKSCPRASPTISPPISTPSWPPAKSSGSASNKLATATAASRSISPNLCPRFFRPLNLKPSHRISPRTRTKISRSSTARRLILRRVAFTPSAADTPANSRSLWELVWAGIITNDTLIPSAISSAPATNAVATTGGDGQPGSSEFLRRLRAKSGDMLPRTAAGRCCVNASRLNSLPPSGAPTSRNNFSSATASSCAKPPPPKIFRAATPPSIPL